MKKDRLGFISKKYNSISLAESELIKAVPHIFDFNRIRNWNIIISNASVRILKWIIGLWLILEWPD